MVHELGIFQDYGMGNQDCLLRNVSEIKGRVTK
jgi:hypothetical protein